MNKRNLNFANKILIALILGIVFGIIGNVIFPKSFNEILSKWILTPVGNVFLRAIKMLVAPLVLTSLIVGTANIKDVKKLGRVGIKIFIYYILTTTLAITLSLIFANIIKPGIGINIPTPKEFKQTETPFVMDIFVNMIPTNPFEALTKGEMLQIIVFSILFGISLSLLGEKGKPLFNILNCTNEVLLKIINIIMQFAPYGVFALISNVIIFQGLDVLLPLLKYTLTIILVLIIQLIFIYGLLLKVIGKINPVNFYKKFWPVMVVAFSTSSSNATIPVNLETCEKKLGIPESIASFTIPLGATINMDGTAIMQGVAAIFIAQIYGINLSISQQLMIILTATLSSIGTAGVPGVGVIMLTMVLQSVGLPVEGIGIILGVDRIIDMARTVVNVTGDAVGTLIVSNSEKELNLNTYNSISI
ncbi:Na+/H+-dicarboxylate symporter [Caloramator fervidus]|uniref:Na+/H+-dicarboxylate symporter n=1 Tax=Caloramator fervidus TaxID=29344 RepID=A0A1H5VGT9_9CLOT|nr:dicarboxylate/amino acid:cation symporter [Caloramator fervidus]SEF86440.1 Na+/H+-dicarboxylate symporter [Caloramator fervidus]